MGKKEKFIFFTELVIAVFIAVIASCAAFSNILLASTDLFNVTSDALGHLAKVTYLAEHYKNMQFPSWCPFWYNGSTMMQYYPPLGYIFMSLIHILTENINLTMKIYCLASLSLGGLGVWAICRKFIGKWCGLFAIPIYCLQPFLSLSLFGGGVLAQGVVFLLSPWLLFFTILFFLKPKKETFLAIVCTVFLLILSHAMHAFMVCFCIMIVALPYVLTKKIKLQPYFWAGIAIALGGMLCGFWWMVGVTGYESPGIPYLLEEATLLYTANFDWFNPTTPSILKFGFAAQILTALGFLLYKFQYRKKQKNDSLQFCVSFCAYLTLFTIVFSFGQNIKLFTLLPIINLLVPGRILSMTAITASIMGAYIVYALHEFAVQKNIAIKILISLINLSIIGAFLYDSNPYKLIFPMLHYDELFDEYMPFLESEKAAFDKGRYEWVAPVNCAETYYSTVKYNCNASDGWNIEGTLHNHSIWGYNIALSSDAEDYVVKDLLYWNVRYLYTLANRTKFLRVLEEYGFQFAAAQSEKYYESGVLYTNDSPSSYFMIDPRDCLVVGPGANAVALEFPFMVHNIETDITKYSKEELKRYNIVYIVEPLLENVSQVEAFEEFIAKLVDQGAQIIIEPSNIQKFSIFGVSAHDFDSGQNSLLTKQSDTHFVSNIDNIPFRSDTFFRKLKGLDEVYYNITSSNKAHSSSIIGSRNVGKGKVYFLGMHLSQYLKSVNISLYGLHEGTEYTYADNVKTLLIDLFSLTKHNEDFVPKPFDVIDPVWDYKGCNFSYSADVSKEILISVTYTPRWKIEIDGTKTDFRSRENLVVLNLPAGNHDVRMTYGVSIFGIIGYIISAIGLILLLIIYFCFDKALSISTKFGNFLSRWLELPDTKKYTKDLTLQNERNKENG